MYQALPPLIVGVKGHAYNFERERESLGPRLYMYTDVHNTLISSLQKGLWPGNKARSVHVFMCTS